MKIGVIGSGYVGTTTAAILANSGHSVVAIDIDQKKVDLINSGKAPFFEYGLDRLIRNATKNNTLTASTNYDDLTDTEVIFACVGTPDNPDGSSNLDYVYAAAETTAKTMQKEFVYVQKSTVPVGTGNHVSSLLKKHSRTPFNYVSNPEFLREGTAIEDTLYFDRIVCGSNNSAAAQTVLDIYKTVEEKRETIASLVNITNDSEAGQYIKTDLNSAELIKVTANAFLALKISFANSIAKLADESKADIISVMDGVGADKRIGRAFLNAGRGYGGGCFPKDVSGLISSAHQHSVGMEIMSAAQEVNVSMPGYIVNKVKNQIGSLVGKNVTVLGLAFKPGTSDARKSPSVIMANLLQHEGAKVTVYDPEAMEEAKEDLKPIIQEAQDTHAACKDADIVFLATDWPEFKEYDFSAAMPKGSLLVDCMNALKNPSSFKGLKYTGVGRN